MRQNATYGSSYTVLSHPQQKLKCVFVAFSSASSPNTKLLSFTTSFLAYGFQRSIMNCKTLCIASCTSLARLFTQLMMGKFSFAKSSIGLCKINKAGTNGQHLMVNGFSFDDRTFFSRLTYYLTCRLSTFCCSFKWCDTAFDEHPRLVYTTNLSSINLGTHLGIQMEAFTFSPCTKICNADS